MIAALVFFAAADGQSLGPNAPGQEEHVFEELAALDVELSALCSAHEQSSDEALQRAIAKWLQQRAGRFQAADAILAASAEREERRIAQLPVSPIEIPPDTSPRKRQFLKDLNQMQQAFAEVRRQRADQSREKVQTLIQRWLEANAAWLGEHLARAKELSAEDAANVEPGETVIEIPADASTEERRLLHEQAALLEEMAEVQALYKDASEEQRQRAVGKWQEENQARLAAHFAEAKRLSAQ